MTSEHSTSNDGTLGKICTKCRLWYPIDKFHKNKSKYDGLSYWCKDCDKHLIGGRCSDLYINELNKIIERLNDNHE